MKRHFWETLRLSVLSFLLGIGSSSATYAQVDGTPEAEIPSRPVLQRGSQGSAVSQVQAVLKLLGYYNGEVTGNYDESTQNAVSRFQAAADLTADGIFDQQSWNRLLPFDPDLTTSEQPPAAPPATTPVTTVPAEPLSAEADFPVLRLGMTGAAVKRLQSRLQDLGYLAGTIDGVFGERTLAAVKAAQTELNLAVDGIVGPATWQALRSQSRL